MSQVPLGPVRASTMAVTARSVTAMRMLRKGLRSLLLAGVVAIMTAGIIASG